MAPLDLIIILVKVALIYGAFLSVVPLAVWAERRGAAFIQDRPGPNRVGPMGLFQPIADFIKLLFKENSIPANVNRLLYALGPFLLLLAVSMVIAAIPIGDHVVIFDRKVNLQIADLNLGLLYILAIGSLSIYGILLGGWASNNKYSLLGAMRSSSQMISYEIPLALAAAGAILYYGSFSLREMVLLQDGVAFGWLPNWGVLYQPLGFLIFFIALFAEANRTPFDIPEAEAEIVAGYHTEYGGMKFATFFMAEYINIAIASSLMVTLYFGGWHLPWVSDGVLLQTLWGSQNLLAVVQVLTFVMKVTFFFCVFIWVRWTLPRFRFDQLTRLAWRSLLPLGLINIVATAIILYLLERG